MTATGGLEGYRIEELDAPTAPEDDLRARYDFFGVIHEEFDSDEPRQPFDEHVVDMRRTYDWSKPLYLSVWDADRTRVVGGGFLGRQYVETNRHLAFASVNVLPELRGQGIGTEVLRRLVAAAREDGRTTLTTNSNSLSPAMDYLPKRGFEAKQVGRLSRLHTKAVDQALMQQWVADADTRASAYELLCIDDRMPDEHADAWLALENVMNTAPRDDLEMEDWVPNVERFRTYETQMLEQGYSVWRVIAVEKETGQWAGYSELYFSPHHPEVVEQGGTAVDPAHRGHGLGRWVKAVNILRLLEERPEAERVETWNAKSNGPMLDINIAMGFDVVKWYTAFQGSVEKVEAALTPR